MNGNYFQLHFWKGDVLEEPPEVVEEALASEGLEIPVEVRVAVVEAVEEVAEPPRAKWGLRKDYLLLDRKEKHPQEVEVVEEQQAPVDYSF